MEYNFFRTTVELNGEQDETMNTEITIRPYAGESQPNIRAFASLCFNGVFVCDNIRIVEDGDKLFVSMPRRRIRADEYRDICHPVKREFREQLYAAILEAYQQSEQEQNVE